MIKPVYLQINLIDINLENIDSNILNVKINYTIAESVLNEILELTVSI